MMTAEQDGGMQRVVAYRQRSVTVKIHSKAHCMGMYL